MIISMVTFKLPERWTVEQAAAVFTTTAPKYLNMPGLIRKHYYISDDGQRAGGIYLWESKAAAEACYAGPWKATVTEKYGVVPEIAFMTAPVTVDPGKGTIETA